MPPESVELEPSRGQFKPQGDVRPHIPEPPPVRLTAVEDVFVSAGAGMEVALDAFYGGILKFQRELDAPAGWIVYRAENFRLRFEVLEPPLLREDFRPITIEVPSLGEVEAQLFDREIEFERQRGLGAAQDVIVLQDPAGNWVALTEFRRFH
jgi:hypothetical protein